MGIQIDAPAKAVGRIEKLNSHNERLVGSFKRNEQLVYDALCESQTPLKAYDLLEQLQDDGLRAPMTIYRALDALTAMGFVKKIESLNAFVAIGNESKPRARAFLICRDCKKAKEITLDERHVIDLFSPIPVSATDVRIEAFGECHQICERPKE